MCTVDPTHTPSASPPFFSHTFRRTAPHGPSAFVPPRPVSYSSAELTTCSIHFLATRSRKVLTSSRQSGMLRWAGLTAIAALPLAAATLRNITVTDQSPMVFYTPSRSGPANETWNVTYSESDWATSGNGAVGNGESTHYTTYIGASISFGFKGTAAYVLGSTGDASDVAVTVGELQAEKGGSEGFLGWRAGLDNKWWTVRVNVTGNGGVNVTGFMFTVDIGSPK